MVVPRSPAGHHPFTVLAELAKARPPKAPALAAHALDGNGDEYQSRLARLGRRVIRTAGLGCFAPGRRPRSDRGQPPAPQLRSLQRQVGVATELDARQRQPDRLLTKRLGRSLLVEGVPFPQV